MSSVASALALLKIPVGEEYMVGRLFTPAGEGPHPYVVLLHGFPGTQQNLDVAALLQRRGWGVLVFSYRGAWGSQGSFSFEHTHLDVQAALAYLRREDVAREHRIDVERLALVGHSMGGFLAVMTGAQDQGIKAVASLSGFNFGLVAGHVAGKPEQEAAFQAMFEESAFFLRGATGGLLMEQLRRHVEEWNLIGQVSKVANRPLLLVGAQQDDVGPVVLHHDSLVAAVIESGAEQLEHRVLDTDHNYVDKRVELAELLDEWLARYL